MKNLILNIRLIMNNMLCRNNMMGLLYVKIK